MRYPLAAPLAVLAAVALHAPRLVQAQGRIIDEGTFAVTRAGAAHTENFRISRIENGLIKATGQVVGTVQRMSSALTVDSLGTPLHYEASVMEKGVKTSSVRAGVGAGRLTATVNDQRGDESMREYPLANGQTLLVDDGFVHQLSFATLGRRPGSVQVVDPRGGRAGAGSLSAMGLEPVDVGGKPVTATHYSLASNGVRREFWLDAAGHLLRVEIPSLQLVAAREELPR
jgi:hypothetical protein